MPVDQKFVEQMESQLSLAFGNVIRAWAQFEFVLLFYFQTFAKIPDQFIARIIWGSLSNFNAKRMLLSSIANSYLKDDALKIFEQQMRRVSNLSEKRNRIAHTLNGYNPTTKKVEFADFDKQRGGKFYFYKSEGYEITNVINWEKDIQALKEDMVRMLPDFASQLKDLPDLKARIGEG